MLESGNQSPSEDSIYEAIVNRYSQWTTRHEDLYQREQRSSSEMPVDSPEAAPSEADIGEESLSALADSAHTSPDSSDLARSSSQDSVLDVQILGAKKGLFELQISEADLRDDPNQFRKDIHRPVKLSERLEEASGSQVKPLVLRKSDAIACEWDFNLMEYYFGPKGEGEGSKWTSFTQDDKHRDAVELKARAIREGLRPNKESYLLEACLDEFTNEEVLGEDDLWYCPNCKKHQQATKQFQIWKVPDILVVHLKRFSNSRLLRDKIDALVDFPITGLDLSARVGQKLFSHKLEEELGSLEGTGLETVAHESLTYDLFAVDEHLGGLGGGHYRAYALNESDQQWYHFDDSHVSKTSPEAAVNSNAYLLFYRRRAEHPIGGKTHEKVAEAAKNPPVEEETAESGAQSSDAHFSSSIKNPFIGPQNWNPSSPVIAPTIQPDDELPSFEESRDSTFVTSYEASSDRDETGSTGQKFPRHSAPSPPSSIASNESASSTRNYGAVNRSNRKMIDLTGGEWGAQGERTSDWASGHTFGGQTVGLTTLHQGPRYGSDMSDQESAVEIKIDARSDEEVEHAGNF